VQIEPVGGPPRRSADKTPNHPPVVRIKNLQVARSTGAANAQNLAVVRVLVTAKRVRNSRRYIWRSPDVEQMATRRAGVAALAIWAEYSCECAEMLDPERPFRFR
jgi:hypothetical protein